MEKKDINFSRYLIRPSEAFTMHNIVSSFSAGISRARCNVISPSRQVTVAVSVINHVVSHYTRHCRRAACHLYSWSYGGATGVIRVDSYDRLLFDIRWCYQWLMLLNVCGAKIMRKVDVQLKNDPDMSGCVEPTLGRRYDIDRSWR